MCGRIACALAPDIIRALFGVVGTWRDKQRYRPSYNIAPDSYVPMLICGHDASGHVVKGQRQIVSAKWRLLPSGTTNPNAFLHKFNTINARIETMLDKKIYAGLASRHRCLILCEGFYEWKKETKQPYFIHLPDKKIIALAGVYDIWVDPNTGEQTTSCAVITVPSSPELNTIHDRMPAIVDDAIINLWLNVDDFDDKTALALLVPWSGLHFYPVSKEVNNPKNDGPNCIKPLEVALPHNSNNTNTTEGPRSRRLTDRLREQEAPPLPDTGLLLVYTQPVPTAPARPLLLQSTSGHAPNGPPDAGSQGTDEELFWAEAAEAARQLESSHTTASSQNGPSTLSEKKRQLPTEPTDPRPAKRYCPDGNAS